MSSEELWRAALARAEASDAGVANNNNSNNTSNNRCPDCAAPLVGGGEGGCLHGGTWHSAVGDCGVRCVGLAFKGNLMRQHWSCCLSTDAGVAGCVKAQHRAPVQLARAPVNCFHCNLPFRVLYAHMLVTQHLTSAAGGEQAVWLLASRGLAWRLWSVRRALRMGPGRQGAAHDAALVVLLQVSVNVDRLCP